MAHTGAYSQLEFFEGIKQTDAITVLPYTYNVFLPFERGASLKLKQNMNEMNIAVTNGGLSPSVPGDALYEFTGTLPVYPDDTSPTPTLPYCSDILEAMGLSTSIGSPETYTPSDESEYSYLQMRYFSGSVANGTCIVNSAKNMMFEGKFIGKIGELLKAELKGTGCVDVVPTLGNYNPNSIALDTTVKTPVLKKITTKICGRTYLVSEFTIDPGFKVATKPDGSTYGHYSATLIPGPSRWTAKVLYDGTINPFTDLIGAALGEFDISYGAAGYITRFASAASSQITACEPSDISGLSTFDLTGIFVNNSWSLSFNAAT
jgi:hypothetical protein